ncbi:hypothetical protein KSK37_08095 [Kaistella sp. DKR-2]|uniref:hypothetical protein n=1 Tax=Kaistella soli TaxID=2849654 RepID=UPI001C263250|nr:hypothetical protein [Kaistella soli]MBU8883039.1 hypothetical protein [Kaistella soli]
MKTVINLLFFLLFMISCNGKSDIKDNETKPIFIRIGFEPTNRNPAEIAVNLNNKYLLFYSPDSQEIPPPKNTINNRLTYETFLKETPKINPLYLKLNEIEIKNLVNIIRDFKEEDFKSIESPPEDGLWTNFLIVYSDGVVKEMHPRNAPNSKQKILYKQILKFLIEKNTDKYNTENIKILNSYN